MHACVLVHLLQLYTLYYLRFMHEFVALIRFMHKNVDVTANFFFFFLSLSLLAHTGQIKYMFNPQQNNNIYNKNINYTAKYKKKTERYKRIKTRLGT